MLAFRVIQINPFQFNKNGAGGTTVKIANNLICRLLAIFHSTQIGRVPYKVTGQ